MPGRHSGEAQLELSLAEQMLLLMEVRDGQLLSGGSLSAAAALVELALERRISCKDPEPSTKLPMSRKLVVIDPNPIGIAEADRVLELMVADSKPRSSYSMVARMAGPVDIIIGKSLADQGLVERLHPKGFVDHSLQYRLLNREAQRSARESASAVRVALAHTTDPRLGATVDLIRNGPDLMSGEAGSGLQPTLLFTGYPDDIRGVIESILRAAGVANSGAS